MLFKVLLIMFLSLVSFTVPLNAITYWSTGRSTQVHTNDTSGLSTVDSSSVTTDTTLNSNNSSPANATNKLLVISQNVSTIEEFDGDFNQTSGPGKLSFGVGTKWEDIGALLKLQTRGIIETLNVKDAIRRANASDICKTGLERYLNSLCDLETWSVKSE